MLSEIRRDLLAKTFYLFIHLLYLKNNSQHLCLDKTLPSQDEDLVSMTRSRQEPITSPCSRLITDAIVYYACVILARAMLDCRCYWQHLNENDSLPRNKAATGGESIMRAVLVLCKIYPYIYLVRFASYLTRVLLFFFLAKQPQSIMIGRYIICLSKLHIRFSFEKKRSTTYNAVSRLHFLGLIIVTEKKNSTCQVQHAVVRYFGARDLNIP